MAIYKKSIPNYYYNSIYEIDYKKLKESGIKALFFDLDNTIIDYNENYIQQSEIDLLDKLSVDFIVIVLSNSRKPRVSKAVNNLFDYVSFARKPFKVGFKKALSIAKVENNQVAMIGDQLMTDVYGGNRMGFKTILVDAVLRDSDTIYTKINRFLEKRVLRKIKKHKPNQYNEVLAEYANKHY